MRTTRTDYEAVTPHGKVLRTFGTPEQAEAWERTNTAFPDARVEVVTTTVSRLPLRPIPALRLVKSSSSPWSK